MPKVSKKKNGYKMPDPLPNGEIVIDIAKKKWRLGPSIGKGGFGEIYSAQDVSDTTKKNKYPYVIKIEPHANGPLFVEMHFFMRNAKQSDIDEFKTSRKLTSLGMPTYLGSGSHEHNDQKYRFVVMEKFGSDIWKLFLENNKVFPTHTVFKLGVQLLDVLEYIHSKGYVHADVKGANILLDLKSDKQVYLVDFGLAGHYYTGKEFKPDPKKAHNGTIEYLSRDAHRGVQTRRGDLEILAYNLVHWLGCTLPWETNLKDPVIVQQSKEKHMEDISGFLKTCFGNVKPPNALVDFFKYVSTLKFDSEPDYKKLRKLLLKGMESAGGSLSSPLVFKIVKSPGKRKSDTEISTTPGKKSRKKNKLNMDKDDLDENVEEDDASLNTNDVVRPKKRGKKPPKMEMNEMKEDDIELNGYLSNDDLNGTENVVPQTKTVKSDVVKKRGRKIAVVPEDDDSSVASDDESNGYTAEMKRIKGRIEATKLTKVKKTKIRKQKADEKDVTPSTSGQTSTRSTRPRKGINYAE